MCRTVQYIRTIVQCRKLEAEYVVCTYIPDGKKASAIERSTTEL